MEVAQWLVSVIGAVILTGALSPVLRKRQSRQVTAALIGIGLVVWQQPDKRNIGLGVGGARKEIFAGTVSRKGNVVASVIASTRTSTLHAFVKEAVSEKVSLLCTDQWAGYRGLDKSYPHGAVDHARGGYVVGAIHTQTVVGFWSMLKGGMVGTFHKVSAKYVPLYVAEFQFRYINRDNADIFGAAVSAY